MTLSRQQNTSRRPILKTPNQDVPQRSHRQRTPDDYIDLLTPETLATFSDSQLDHVRMLLASAIPKPAPKLIDLRFEIDLLISRFYIVLFVGKDRRKKQRSQLPPLLARISNVAIATLILIGVNVLITVCLLMFLYLVKSAFSIDLIQGAHLQDHINQF